MVLRNTCIIKYERRVILENPDDVVYIADDDVYEYLRSYNDGNIEVLS